MLRQKLWILVNLDNIFLNLTVQTYNKKRTILGIFAMLLLKEKPVQERENWQSSLGETEMTKCIKIQKAFWLARQQKEPVSLTLQVSANK